MTISNEYLTTFEAAAMLHVSRSALQSARTWRRYSMKNCPQEQRNDCKSLEHIPFYMPVGNKVLYRLNDCKGLEHIPFCIPVGNKVLYRRTDLQRFLDQMEVN